MARTERIEFPETGDFWEFRSFIPYGLRNEWLPKAAACLVAPEPGQEDQEFQLDLSKGEELLRVSEELLLKNTVTWSYGPLTRETLLNEVPAHQCDLVANRMMELYRPLLVPSTEPLPNGSSSA